MIEGERHVMEPEFDIGCRRARGARHRQPLEQGAGFVRHITARAGDDIGCPRVAVERNLLVVRRAHYGSEIVAEGDEVEIVNFVGGG